MKTQVNYPVTVFYDGACRVCSIEMAHLQKNDRFGRLRFVNIALPSFEPAEYGRSLDEFMAAMHVRDATGRFFTGIDAFVQIRSAFPSGSLPGIVGRILGFPVVKPLAETGYRIFARNRHLLPKRKVGCGSGRCQV